MSRTHKIQRARKVHAPSKVWRVAYGTALKTSNLKTSQAERYTRDDYARAQAAGETALIERGLDPQAPNASSQEDKRTCGVRYGNQRKMRARMALTARRAERKREADPLLDREGDVGLPMRTPNAPKRRGGW